MSSEKILHNQKDLKGGLISKEGVLTDWSLKDPVLSTMHCALENNRRLAPVKTKTTTEAREA